MSTALDLLRSLEAVRDDCIRAHAAARAAVHQASRRREERAQLEAQVAELQKTAAGLWAREEKAFEAWYAAELEAHEQAKAARRAAA